MKLFECPVCEHRFRGEDADSNDQAQCPACQRAFAVSDLKTVTAGNSPQPGDVAAAAKPAASAVAPRRLKSSPAEQTAQPPRQAPAISQTTRNPSIPHDALSALTGFDQSVRKHLPGKQGAHPLLILALAIVAVGGLFSLVVMLNPPSAARDNADDDGQPVGQVAAESRSTANPTSAIDNVLARSGLNSKKKTQIEPVEEIPEYFTFQQWKDTWKKINSYLVKLDVETPLSRHVATGLIVDSRGWVVTSWSSIRDAARVNVTLGAQQLNADSPFREMTDAARGIVCKMPELDLAIIAINRAQVISLADIELDDQDNLVPSQRCLIARVPPPGHKYWITECRINRRATVEQLPDELVKRVHQTNSVVLQDRRLDWILHPADHPGKETSELAGAPIISREGKVLGIHVGNPTSGQCMAIPAIKIRELVKTAGSELEPFPRMAELAALVSAGEKPEPQTNDLRIRSGDLLQNIQQALENCRRTDWTAENLAEYQSFQALAQNMDELMQLRYFKEPDQQLSELIETESDQQLEEIIESLKHDLEFEDVVAGKGNHWFASAVNPSNPWYCIFVRVNKNAAMSPRANGRETVTFKLLGTDQFVLETGNFDLTNFRSGEYFMLVGRLDPRGPMKSNGQAVPRINSSWSVMMQRGGGNQ